MVTKPHVLILIPTIQILRRGRGARPNVTIPQTVPAARNPVRQPTRPIPVVCIRVAKWFVKTAINSHLVVVRGRQLLTIVFAI